MDLEASPNVYRMSTWCFRKKWPSLYKMFWQNSHFWKFLYNLLQKITQRISLIRFLPKIVKIGQKWPETKKIFFLHQMYLEASPNVYSMSTWCSQKNRPHFLWETCFWAKLLKDLLPEKTLKDLLSNFPENQNLAILKLFHLSRTIKG